MPFIYSMEYYSATKKNKILSLEETWMVLEDIRVNEISQAYAFSYMEAIKAKIYLNVE
jgi:hypothetical protein